MNDETVLPQLEIQKIYLKDVSLETPNSPKVFTETWQPETSVQLDNVAERLAEDVYEAVLTLTVTAKLGEKTAYLIEIQQAGIFTIKGFNDEQLGHILGAFCPNTLFPFAREALASLINKGGFPAVLLNPINFDALYLQRLQTQQAQQERTEH
jgi:preprotein translocase subunit SecB